VIGFALDALDLGRVRVRELGGERIEHGERGGGNAAQLGDAGLGGERLEPKRFDPDALADQAPFAKERAKLGGFVGVAPIDRGNGMKW
jgi:hypothetical protein